MSRILALVREDLAAGFALAGVDTRAASDAAALQVELRAAAESGRYGMVVVEAERMAEMDPGERAAFEALSTPLIVEVPAEMVWQEAAEAPAEDYVARLVRRAVGYQLTVRM